MKNLRFVSNNFKQAAQLIIRALDKDPEVSSPSVIVEPANSLIQKAVELLKKINPSYFVGVRKIIVGSSPNYGHVESGKDKDPAVINVNLTRIQNELSSGSEQEIVRALAGVLSHEAGHSKSFRPDSGFVGGESVAEAEEKRVLSLIDKLPEYNVS